MEQRIMMQNYLYPEYKIEQPINAFSSDGFLAERVGFEPTLRFRKHTFQACAFGHSATSPEGAQRYKYDTP